MQQQKMWNILKKYLKILFYGHGNGLNMFVRPVGLFFFFFFFYNKTQQGVFKQLTAVLHGVSASHSIIFMLKQRFDNTVIS